MEAIVGAARGEIAKIDLLRRELADTRGALQKEAEQFDRRLPRIEKELQIVVAQLEETIAPELSRRPAGYGDLADKRGEVREALAACETLRDMEQRRDTLKQIADADLLTVEATPQTFDTQDMRNASKRYAEVGAPAVERGRTSLCGAAAVRYVRSRSRAATATDGGAGK